LPRARACGVFRAALSCNETLSIVYSLDQFASMFADPVRMDAYLAAIERSVRPGDTVVDLGCGPGIFALLACKAGARAVYAIDLEGVVDFGRHLAFHNGFADRVHFLRGDSRQIELPVRADVIISDVRGVLPLFSGAVATMNDARDRFLKPGGILMPSRDTLFAAVLELPDQYKRITESWKSIPGLDLSLGLPLVLNASYRYHLRPEQMLSSAEPWTVLDYRSEVRLPARGRLALPAVRAGTGHGIGLWFATELVEGIGYSTGPRPGETVYGQIFLPWLEPLSFCQGDVCEVDLRAYLVGNDYVWQWETAVPASAHRASAQFRQSTFYGSFFSISSLKKRTADFVPVLSENGLAERWLLHAMDGRQTLEQIAEEGARLFPHVFRRVEDAFYRAADVAEKLSK
jgi:protein arginine N-methyltransferase 1